MNHFEMYRKVGHLIDWIKYDYEGCGDFMVKYLSKALIKECGVKAVSDAESRELVKYLPKKPAFFHYLMRNYGKDEALACFGERFFNKYVNKEPKQGLNYHNPVFAKLLLRK